MKKLILLLLVFFSISFVSCTDNIRTKSFGGESEIKLPKGKKLVVVTWKDSDLWYLTRDMRKDELPEIYDFTEESSWGMFEGNYKIVESK